MTTVSGTWTHNEVESFLETATVPIRIATRRSDGSLWIVALWFRYRNGTIDCATSARADVVRFLRNDPEVGFDISTNEPPYRGIRGSGTVSLSPDENKVVLEALIDRYLDAVDSRLSDWLLDEDREEVHIRLTPETIYSWDYTDRMGSA